MWLLSINLYASSEKPTGKSHTCILAAARGSLIDILMTNMIGYRQIMAAINMDSVTIRSNSNSEGFLTIIPSRYHKDVSLTLRLNILMLMSKIKFTTLLKRPTAVAKPYSPLRIPTRYT